MASATNYRFNPYSFGGTVPVYTPDWTDVLELNDLKGINLTEPFEEGHIVTWDPTTGEWVNKPLEEVGVQNSDLGDLRDVDVVVKNPGDTIIWNGVDWVAINVEDQNPAMLSELADTAITSSLTLNHLLIYDGSLWTNRSIDALPGFIEFVAEAKDVLINNLRENDLLRWNGVKWENTQVGVVPEVLDDLLDVSAGTAGTDNVLVYDGQNWLATPITSIPGLPSVLDDLTDVSVNSPQNNELLVYTNGVWTNMDTSGIPGIIDMLDELLDVSLTNPADGDFLVYDAQQQAFVNTAVQIPEYLNDLGDVLVFSPQEEETLLWDGTRWANSAFPQPGVANFLNDLGDVLIDTEADGDVLVFNATTGNFENTQDIPGVPKELGDLTNVDTDGVEENSVLYYDVTDSTWKVTTTIPNSPQILDDLNDCTVSNEAEGQLLCYSAAGQWENKNIEDINGIPKFIGELQDVTITNPETGNVIMYNGTEFVNVDITTLVPRMLNDMLDVTYSGAPAHGDVLISDGTTWTNTGELPGPKTLVELNDTNIDQGTLVDGQVLTFQSNMWVNKDLDEVVETLEDLTDTDVTGMDTSKVNYLVHDGNKWIASEDLPGGTTELPDLLDVEFFTPPQENEILYYNGSSWVNSGTIPNSAVFLNDLDDVDVGSPSNQNLLVYINGVWKPRSIYSVPGLVTNLNSLSDVNITTTFNKLDDENVLVWDPNLQRWTNELLGERRAAFLSVLDDVLIPDTTLEEGQTLLYNGTKWVNGKLPTDGGIGFQNAGPGSDGTYDLRLTNSSADLPNPGANALSGRFYQDASGYEIINTGNGLFKNLRSLELKGVNGNEASHGGSILLYSTDFSGKTEYFMAPVTRVLSKSDTHVHLEFFNLYKDGALKDKNIATRIQSNPIDWKIALSGVLIDVN